MPKFSHSYGIDRREKPMPDTTRGFARALSASLCFGIGAGELARRKTVAEATAEAREMGRVHRCRAFVYRRADGTLQPSTFEPELLPAGPGAELVVEIAR
jgi:hypothetical protein